MLLTGMMNAMPVPGTSIRIWRRSAFWILGQVSAVMMANRTAFFALFQAEGGQHFLHGRAGTHGAEADTDTVALVQGQERVRGAAVGDGDQPVKGICHS